MRYRRPYGTAWEELDLDQAMDMIAERVIAARENGWQQHDGHGTRVDRMLVFAHLGGAKLDNEENYLIKKLFTAMGAFRSRTRVRRPAGEHAPRGLGSRAWPSASHGSRPGRESATDDEAVARSAREEPRHEEAHRV